MSGAKKDSKRAHAALAAIVDGRPPIENMSSIMVTLEHLVAATLLVVMDNDPKKAATMLNEGLVEGVEKRLAYYASKN